MKINSNAEMDMVKGLEQTIKGLAREREMIIKTGIMTVEEITDFINEKGEKYRAIYSSMDPFELFIDLLSEASERIGKANE